MRRKVALSVLAGILSMAAAGCCHPEITAVSLSPQNQGEVCNKKGEIGIPFYLPKPLLIIAKNFRNIEEAKVGQMGAAPIPESIFDSQAGYGSVNATVSATPPAAPPDSPAAPGGGKGGSKEAGPLPAYGDGAPVVPGRVPGDEFIGPQVFYTYHIIFVPDLSQKYALKIKGGAGEFRAAMNLINGWQFTGVGPFYMKDSSTAQNLLAGGIGFNFAARGVGDIISSITDMRTKAHQERGLLPGEQAVQLVQTIRRFCPSPAPICIPNYAEIRVFEPQLLPDGVTRWVPVIREEMSRTILGTVSQDVLFAPKTTDQQTDQKGKADGSDKGKKTTGDKSTPPSINYVVPVQPTLPLPTPELLHPPTPEPNPNPKGASPSGPDLKKTGELPIDPAIRQASASDPTPVFIPHSEGLPPAMTRIIDVNSLSGVVRVPQPLARVSPGTAGPSPSSTPGIPAAAGAKKEPGVVQGGLGSDLIIAQAASQLQTNAQMRQQYAARALGITPNVVSPPAVPGSARLESGALTTPGAQTVLPAAGTNVVINNQPACATSKKKCGLFSWCRKHHHRIESNLVLGSTEWSAGQTTTAVQSPVPTSLTQDTNTGKKLQTSANGGETPPGKLFGMPDSQ